ncbi:MAG: hypothetical protein RLZZ347_177 [Candidatus Parcubacteria bacterium]|jgi:uncharacterized Fe-S cluster-containing radical SAM superfamily protein
MCQACRSGNHAGCVTGDAVGYHCSCQQCQVEKFNRIEAARDQTLPKRPTWKIRRKKRL